MTFNQRVTCLAGALTTIFMTPDAALAAPTESPVATPEVLKQIADCQAVRGETARLQCYDAAAAALGKAVAAKELYVVEKRQMKEARRSLFGLTLPNLGLFGDDVEDQDQITEIVSTAAAATQGADGNWVVTLAEGSVWQQTDGRPIAVGPRLGTAITVKRGALGSYKLNVGKQPAVKVKRAR